MWHGSCSLEEPREQAGSSRAVGGFRCLLFAPRYAGGEKGHVCCQLRLLLGVRQETAHHLLLSGVRPAVLLPRLLLPPRGQPRRGATGGAGRASGRKLVCPSGASTLTRISFPQAGA